METGKTSKYLKYAIGEILLVMIGILLALQVNNWNSDREERQREALLVSQINIEMQDNLEQFNAIQNSIKNVVNAGQEIVSIIPLDATKIIQQKFSSNFPEFLYCPSFDPYQGTIKSIISSGNLNLIQNDSLRKLIVSWEDVLSDYKEEEQIAWQYGYKFMEWATDNFPNPRYVEPQWGMVDYRGLQARMGEKINRYQYCIEGEDGKLLKQHIETMIKLTTPSRDD